MEGHYTGTFCELGPEKILRLFKTYIHVQTKRRRFHYRDSFLEQAVSVQKAQLLY